MGPRRTRDSWFLATLYLWAGLVPTTHAEDLGLRIAPGFRITVYADHELANDIFAMTLDSQGRVVVTGAGYVKVLHDTKGTGKGDKATLFATPHTGAMGMCFDGNDLYLCGDGWFSRYRDGGGLGRADGNPEHIVPLAFNEHGGHAMRKGPDGWWYIIGGNDSVFDRRHETLPHSPVRNPEGGALLRLTPDCKQCEVIAQGFRNPYDFDFNEAGDIFTYDSDCERDFFLPWYMPTRIYHVGYAAHHGWRLPSYLRSWCRRDFYVDTVDILWPVGRGSPTGVICYRHEQFPEHYRGGLFALDWTFGKVYFFPLEPEGASYRTRPEVFLEAVGTSGFDPTDIVVAPDGSLFLCMGGRGTRGAVFHIEYVGDGSSPPTKAPVARSEIETVLQAPQPLDAWSRARWEPLARKLGRSPFTAVVADERHDDKSRMRAIEIVTELFGGLPLETAHAGAEASSPVVRSRVAWSLGRVPCKQFEEVLARLAEDPHQRVRCAALQALADRYHQLPDGFRSTLPLGKWLSSDKRVRLAWARLAALRGRRPDSFHGAQLALWRGANPAGMSALYLENFALCLAKLWDKPATTIDLEVVENVLSVLNGAEDTELRLQGVRLLMLALGDYHLHNPPLEVYTAFSVPISLKGQEKVTNRILTALRSFFPTGDALLDQEAARVLAMLEDDSAATVDRVAALWTEKSSPTEDMHYLVVMSRLRGRRERAVTSKVANALLGLHRKLAGKEQRTKQVWGERLSEVVANLLRHDPPLAKELIRHPAFVNPGHLELALGLNAEHRKQAATLYLKAVREDPEFAWSGQLIELLGLLPAANIAPDLRKQWENYALRDAILARLAEKPVEADREKFLAGLESTQTPIVRLSLTALERLPRDEAPSHLLPVLRLLRRFEQQPREKDLRDRTLAFLVRQTDKAFAVTEKGTDAPALRQAYLPVFQWFGRQHPALASQLNDTSEQDPAVWDKVLKSVDWTKGDAGRGEVLFRNRACQTCHAGTRALGPDLAGVSKRFSRDDLFTAIIYPSRDVAPAYRTTVIETKDGQVHHGIVAFDSADGIILQTGATTTERIATSDIVSQQPSNRSLMPNGLLKDLKPSDLADLYRYLQTLASKTATTTSRP